MLIMNVLCLFRADVIEQSASQSPHEQRGTEEHPVELLSSDGEEEEEGSPAPKRTEPVSTYMAKAMREEEEVRRPLLILSPYLMVN
jgi:hypothetical protein